MQHQSKSKYTKPTRKTSGTNNMPIATNKTSTLAISILLAITTIAASQTNNLAGYDKSIFITNSFLKTPYKLFPLGEGKDAEIANKPLYSFEAFDCLTFVETALALSYDPKDFLKTLSDIRYHGQKRNFTNRNHFMSTEWNYYNQQKGYITDITTKVHSNYHTVQTLINKPGWLRFLAQHPQVIAKYTNHNDNYAAIKKTLLQYAAESRPKTATTAYITLADLMGPSGKINTAVYNKLPKIFIVEIVRKNWGLANKIGTELDISHIGFGIKTTQGLVLRHASEIKGAVVDTPFLDYLTRQAKQKSFAGINIEAINFKQGNTPQGDMPASRQ